MTALHGAAAVLARFALKASANATYPLSSTKRRLSAMNAEALGRTTGPPNPARALSALWAIPVPEGRKEWLTIVWAARHGGVAFDDFLVWARAGAKYTSDAEELKAWESFDPERLGGITAGTLFHTARHHGWRDPENAVEQPSLHAATRADFNDTSRQYELLSAAEVLKRPPLEWVIKWVLPAKGLAVLFGPSGSGKSFVAMNLACCIAAGQPWFKYPTKQRAVVYVALEGEGGISNRVAAIRRDSGEALPDKLKFVLGQAFNLPSPDDVLALAAAIAAATLGEEAVIVLDTLNRAAPGLDENTSADMGRILEGAKDLQRMTGGLVVLVHHTGKDASRGMRGHSSLHAGVDAAIEVRRDGDRREWGVAKAKDGADGKFHAFRLEIIELDPDCDGEPVSSCVVRADVPISRRAVQPTGKNQLLVMSRLHPLFGDGMVGKPGAPPDRRCIQLDVAIAAAASALTCESARRKTRARAVITDLVSLGILGCHDDWLWLLP